MHGKGIFIAIYGPDGVGKSKQVSLLEERFRESGMMCRSIRYPIYDVKPTGPRLEGILHKGREKLGNEEEMQALFAQNRKDFEPTLKSWLGSGVSVVAENYKGTGIVWGTVRGVSMEKMEEINKDMIEPDVAIVLDGPRHGEPPFEGHPYSGEDEDEWYRARKMYLTMADKCGWVRVGADAPMLTVASRIWAVVKPVLAMR